MTRTIKFRAWDSSSKKINEITHLRLPHREDLSPGLFLMQFTGLLDKNGKEIYEGDIVRLHHPDEEKDEDEIGVVIFDEFGARVDLGGGKASYGIVTHWMENEVIGNIYQNPELLN